MYSNGDTGMDSSGESEHGRHIAAMLDLFSSPQRGPKHRPHARRAQSIQTEEASSDHPHGAARGSGVRLRAPVVLDKAAAFRTSPARPAPTVARLSALPDGGCVEPTMNTCSPPGATGATANTKAAAVVAVADKQAASPHRASRAGAHAPILPSPGGTQEHAHGQHSEVGVTAVSGAGVALPDGRLRQKPAHPPLPPQAVRSEGSDLAGTGVRTTHRFDRGVQGASMPPCSRLDCSRRIDALRDELQACVAARRRLLAVHKDAERRLDVAAQACNALQCEVQRHDSAQAELRGLLQSAEAERDSLRAQLSGAQESLAQCTASSAELGKRLRDLDVKYEATQQALARVSAGRDSATASLHEATEAHAVTRSQLEASGDAYHMEMTRRTEAEAALASSAERLTSAHEDRNATAVALATLQSALHALRKKHDALAARCTDEAAGWAACKAERDQLAARLDAQCELHTVRAQQERGTTCCSTQTDGHLADRADQHVGVVAVSAEALAPASDATGGAHAGVATCGAGCSGQHASAAVCVTMRQKLHTRVQQASSALGVVSASVDAAGSLLRATHACRGTTHAAGVFVGDNTRWRHFMWVVAIGVQRCAAHVVAGIRQFPRIGVAVLRALRSGQAAAVIETMVRWVWGRVVSSTRRSRVSAAPPLQVGLLHVLSVVARHNRVLRSATGSCINDPAVCRGAEVGKSANAVVTGYFGQRGLVFDIDTNMTVTAVCYCVIYFGHGHCCLTCLTQLGCDHMLRRLPVFTNLSKHSTHCSTALQQ